MLEGIKVCLDTGHLWISSLVYNLDFISTVEYLANTGRVATVHVHDNNSKLPGYLADEHLSPGKGIIPLSDAIGILKESGVSNFVLESVDDAEGEGFRFLRDIFSSF